MLYISAHCDQYLPSGPEPGNELLEAASDDGKAINMEQFQWFTSAKLTWKDF